RGHGHRRWPNRVWVSHRFGAATNMLQAPGRAAIATYLLRSRIGMSYPQARMGAVASGRLARELGRLLRLERESARLTQEQLADRIGMKRQQLARFEAGRHPSSTKQIEDLFAALGLQIRMVAEPTDRHLDARIDRSQTSAVNLATALL